MDYRVIWVHGIGPTQPGYSLGWDQVYNQYLNFPPTDYIEVLWSDVFGSTSSANNQGMNQQRISTTQGESLRWEGN